jgi:hypothetical protein
LHLSILKQKEKLVDAVEESGIINTGDAAINAPIELGHPVDIAFGAKNIKFRQQRILSLLPKYGSQAVVRKRDISMLDLSAMTAQTGDEFAMFTRKGERLIVRGNSQNVPLDTEDLASLRDDGYRWSGHTHIGITEASVIPSKGDMEALDVFRQRNSAIYNAAGKHGLILQE